jgi:hypothetical protein
MTIEKTDKDDMGPTIKFTRLQRLSEVNKTLANTVLLFGFLGPTRNFQLSELITGTPHDRETNFFIPHRMLTFGKE